MPSFDTSVLKHLSVPLILFQAGALLNNDATPQAGSVLGLEVTEAVMVARRAMRSGNMTAPGWPDADDAGPGTAGLDVKSTAWRL